MLLFAAIKAGQVPTRREVFTDLAVIEQNPYFSKLLPIIHAAKTKPSFMVDNDVLEILQKTFHEPLQRKALVLTSLTDATEKIKELLARDVR